MRVLFVASEAFPLAKTGGLGDVAGALPAALAAAGVDVRLLMPAYPAAKAAVAARARRIALGDSLGFGEASLLERRMPDSGVPLWLLDCPALYDRPGGPYLGPDGRDWSDNALRFGLLGRVAALVGAGGLGFWQPDVVHAHDWQAGLAPAYLAAWRANRVASVFTIHNMQYQGLFGPEALDPLGLPSASFSVAGLEYYGRVSFLKAGLHYSDLITTVSPTYAREIQGPTEGFGLHGLLAFRAADLVGILNGVDYAVWDPRRDVHIDHRYGPDDLEAKAENGTALRRRLGLDAALDRPLAGVVSRFVEQKGIDLLAAALEEIVATGVQVAALGSGDPLLEKAFVRAAAAHPGAVAVRLGYDEALAHQFMAGCDMLLVPSRFEPCGLTQMYALRYGALPVVRRTGGLADTVTDADADGAQGTGFVFEQPQAAGLATAVRRSVALFRRPAAWRAVQRRAMAEDFGWARTAGRYVEVYQRALAKRTGAVP
jgi:starch synthase